MCTYVRIQWYLSIKGSTETQLAGCLVLRGVTNSEVDLYTALYVVGTVNSILIREASFIQSVLYREVQRYNNPSVLCPDPAVSPDQLLLQIE